MKKTRYLGYYQWKYNVNGNSINIDIYFGLRGGHFASLRQTAYPQGPYGWRGV